MKTDINKIKSNGNRQITNDLILSIFYLVIILSFVLAIFLMRNKEANVFIFLLSIIMALYLGYLGYRSFTRQLKLRKFIKKIKDDDEIETVTGKATKINLIDTDNKYGYAIAYVIVMINKVEYLLALPEQVTVKKTDTPNLLLRLNEMDLTINYYKNSKIIDIEDNIIYEEILKIKSNKNNNMK